MVSVNQLIGVPKCGLNSGSICGRQPSTGAWWSFASGFQKINICAEAVTAG